MWNQSENVYRNYKTFVAKYTPSQKINKMFESEMKIINSVFCKFYNFIMINVRFWKKWIAYYP